MFICNFAIAQLQINEVCSDNDALFPAANGNYYDWLEIYNSSDLPIQLSDYYLSDDDSKLEKWNFNPEILQPKSYVIVFASDLKNTPEQQHANFKLSSKGESIYLSNSNGLIDSMSFGAINEDYSYGRLEESSSIKTHLAIPTPGTSNSESGTVTNNYESGFYDSGIDLKLSAANGHKIYYTTNGDDPTLESKIYDGKIRIKDEYEVYEYLNEPTTPLGEFACKYEWKLPKAEIPRCQVVSYRTFDLDNNAGKVYRKTYFLAKNHTIPVTSIVMDNMSLFHQDTGIYVPGNGFQEDNPCWTGNYFYSGWERNAQFSFFTDYRLITDEAVGLRLHGGSSRNAPQKSLRLYARKQYGINKLANNFFPELDVPKFNNILLRSTMGSWYETKLKDAVTMEIVRNLNFEQTYVIPSVVYINGNYWGMNEIRNRIDNDFLAEKYGINKDSINIVHPSTPELLKSGTYEDFRPIYNMIAEEDLTIESNYNYIESKLDIPNIIDYYIAELYFNNFDWPHNNIMFWNSPELDGKYRAIFYDLDAGWGDPNYNMFDHATQDSSSDWPNPKEINIVLIKLLENEDFKSAFIERAFYLLENDFKYSNLLNIINKYKNIYKTDIDNSINRFGLIENKESWYNHIRTIMIDFAKARECLFNNQLVNHFNLDPELLCNYTSVSDSDNQTFTLSPNPANSVITLDNINSHKVEIFSLEGIKIMEIPSFGLSQIEINISALLPSVYFAKTDNKTIKFVVIK